MTDQFESKIADLIVAKLRNSPAIVMAMARVSRLDLAHFDSQPDSPRLVQRLHRGKLGQYTCWQPRMNSGQSAATPRNICKIHDGHLERNPIDFLGWLFRLCLLIRAFCISI